MRHTMMNKGLFERETIVTDGDVTTEIWIGIHGIADYALRHMIGGEMVSIEYFPSAQNLAARAEYAGANLAQEIRAIT